MIKLNKKNMLFFFLGLHITSYSMGGFSSKKIDPELKKRIFSLCTSVTRLTPSDWANLKNNNKERMPKENNNESFGTGKLSIWKDFESLFGPEGLNIFPPEPKLIKNANKCNICEEIPSMAYFYEKIVTRLFFSWFSCNFKENFISSGAFFINSLLLTKFINEFTFGIYRVFEEVKDPSYNPKVKEKVEKSICSDMEEKKIPFTPIQRTVFEPSIHFLSYHVSGGLRDGYNKRLYIRKEFSVEDMEKIKEGMFTIIESGGDGGSSFCDLDLYLKVLFCNGTGDNIDERFSDFEITPDICNNANMLLEKFESIKLSILNIYNKQELILDRLEDELLMRLICFVFDSPSNLAFSPNKVFKHVTYGKLSRNKKFFKEFYENHLIGCILKLKKIILYDNYKPYLNYLQSFSKRMYPEDRLNVSITPWWCMSTMFDIHELMESDAGLMILQGLADFGLKWIGESEKNSIH